MLPSGSRLEFEIQVEDGSGLLLLRPRTLFGWLKVERLELQIPNVTFPLDITGGMAQFRAQRCNLLACTLAVDAAGAAELLYARAAPLAAAGFTELRARAGDASFELGGVARVGAERAEIVIRVVPHFRGGAVELEVQEASLLGLLRRPAWLLAHDLLSVLLGAGSSLPESEAAGQTAPLVMALGRVRLQPLDLFLSRALPAAGWKVPLADRVRLSAASLDSRGARVAWSSDQAALAETPPLAAAATDGGDAALLRSDMGGAVAAYRARLTQDAKRSTDRLLSVLLARESTLREALELAREALGRWPGWVPALLALAAAESRGSPAAAAQAAATALASIAEGELSLRLARAAAALYEVSAPERAAEFHERVLRQEPGDTEATAALLRDYQQRGDWRKLVSLLEAGVQTAPANAAEARRQAGTLLSLSELYGQRLADDVRARAALERAVALDAENGAAWAALGRMHSSALNLPAAIVAFERLVELTRGGAAEAPTHAQVAALREQLGELDEAQASWQRALSLSPADPELWLRAATLAERRGDRAGAVDAWGRLVALEPPLDRFLPDAAARVELERARICRANGRDDEARSALRAAWRRAPNSPSGLRAVQALADDARERSDDRAEARWLDELLRSPSDSPPSSPSSDLALRRAQLHAAAGEWAEARARLDKSVLTAPAARRLQADVLGQLGEHGARAELLASLATETPSLWISVVQARLDAHDLDGAAQALSAAAQLAPDDLAVRDATAELAWQRHAWDEVAALYPPLLERSTGRAHARYLVRLAVALERQGAVDAARARYREAVVEAEAEGEDRATAWRRLAELEERAGAYQAAAQAWSEAARDRLSDESTESRAEKHRRAAELLHRRLGHSAQALIELESALQDDAGHLPSLDLLESIHTELGNDEALAAALRKRLLALAGDPRRRELVRRLAELDSRRGDRDGALHAWRWVLEQDPTDPEAMRQLAEAALEAHDVESAARLNAALQQNGLGGDERRDLFIRFADLLLDARPEDADRALAAALALDPPDRAALVEKRVRLLLERLVDPVAALAAAQEEHSQNPDDLRLLSLVAETALAADEPAVRVEALTRLLPSAKTREQWTGLVLEAAELYAVRLDDPTRAQALYEQVLESDPSCLPAAALRLAVKKARGRADERALLQALKATGGAGVDELTRLAQIYSAHDESRAAAEVLADAVERHVADLTARGEPLDERGRALMGDLSATAAAAADYASAARGLTATAEVEADAAAASSALGEAALLYRTRLDDWPAAARSLERALARRPDSALLLADFEAVMRHLDDPNRLRQAFEAHLASLSGAARGPVLARLAQLDSALGDADAASQHNSELRRWEAPRIAPAAVSKLPDSGRGRALFLAVSDASAAANSQPGLAGAELLTAIADLRRQVDSLSARAVDESRKLRLRLAWMYHRAGDVNAAHGELERLVAEDPQNRSLLAALVETNLADERWSDALAALDRLQRLTESPADRATLVFRMGELHRSRLGDDDSAAEEYLRAIDLDSEAQPPLWRLLDHFWAKHDDDNLIDIARSLDALGALATPPMDKVTQARAWVALALDAFDTGRENLTPPPSLKDELVAALGELAGWPQPPHGLAAAARRLALVSAIAPR